MQAEMERGLLYPLVAILCREQTHPTDNYVDVTLQKAIL